MKNNKPILKSATALPALNTNISTPAQKWLNIEYKLDTNSLITKALLRYHINKFYKDILSNLEENQHVLFILRAKFDTNQIASFCNLQKINKTCENELIDFLYNRLSLSNEAYLSTPIQSIIISYGIRAGKIKSELLIENKDTIFQYFHKHKLPIVFNPSEYGKILSKINNLYWIQHSKKISIILENIDNVNKVQYYKEGQLIFSWTDTLLDKENEYFTREINKTTYYFMNKELILQKLVKKTSPMVPSKTAQKRDNKIITMDLETVLIDNKHIPYLLSWYDGNISKSYFISSLDSNLEENILNMISRAMNDLCIRKYRNYKVYLHNFAKFDGYFFS